VTLGEDREGETDSYGEITKNEGKTYTHFPQRNDGHAGRGVLHTRLPEKRCAREYKFSEKTVQRIIRRGSLSDGYSQARQGGTLEVKARSHAI